MSWLPDWGFTGSERTSDKPQRNVNRPGTPRPSTVEPLQSQARAKGPAKENQSLQSNPPFLKQTHSLLHRLCTPLHCLGIMVLCMPDSHPAHMDSLTPTLIHVLLFTAMHKILMQPWGPCCIHAHLHLQRPEHAH